MSTIRGRKLLAWSKHVIARDAYTCQFCLTQKDVIAHHVHPKEIYPDLSLVMENGLTLCRSCHSQYHNPPEKHLGKKLSEAAKKKVGDAARGRKDSPETKARKTLAQIGNKHSLGYKQTEGHKRKLSEVQKGRKKTKEHLAKIGLAMKGKPWTDAAYAARGLARKEKV